MGIELDDAPRATSTPVVKRAKIGEKFVGAIVRVEQRDQTKTVDGVRTPVMKPNGKARQELVVHCVVHPGNTAEVSLGDDRHLPEPGEKVRLILKGKAFGDWIEQRKGHRGGKLNVGDVVVQTVTHAQQYDANGNPKGGEITDQATADATPRGTSLGFYGPVTIHEPKEQVWVEAAEKAWHEWKDGTAIAADTDFVDTDPF